MNSKIWSFIRFNNMISWKAHKCQELCNSIHSLSKVILNSNVTHYVLIIPGYLVPWRQALCPELHIVVDHLNHILVFQGIFVTSCH